MTPKEKAKELVDRYERYSNPYYYGPLVNFGPHFSEEEKRKGAKKCASIAVDEIIGVLNKLEETEYKMEKSLAFWQQVKQEIENL